MSGVYICFLCLLLGPFPSVLFSYDVLALFYLIKFYFINIFLEPICFLMKDLMERVWMEWGKWDEKGRRNFNQDILCKKISISIKKINEMENHRGVGDWIVYLSERTFQSQLKKNLKTQTVLFIRVKFRKSKIWLWIEKIKNLGLKFRIKYLF